MFKPDKQLAEQIDLWIEQNSSAFVKDLNRLVAIPSVSVPGDAAYPFGRHCANVLDEVSALAAGYGFQVDNHAYHCGSLLVKGRSPQAKRIGLYGHLDVVPPGDGWYYPPFSCTEKDGFLIGRGVWDNKGPALCSLYALRFLNEHNIRLDHDVLVYFGLSEETGMADIEYFCRTQQVPDFNLVTDTDFPVCYGEKGRIQAEISRAFEGNLVSFHGGEAVNIIPAKAEALLRDVSMETAVRQLGGREDIQIRQDGPLIRVSARGLARHAAFPDGAVSAIHVLAGALAQSGLLQGSGQDAMAALAAMTADFYGNGCGIAFEDRESGKLTSAGSTAHGENGLLTVQFDIRYPVTVCGDLVTDGFARRAESLGFSVTGTEVSPPAYVSLDDPRISRLCEICDYVQGKYYEPYTMGGGTYSRKLPHAVGFGPGIPDAGNLFGNGHGGCHQPDECVPFSMLKNALKTYILALLELDGML